MRFFRSRTNYLPDDMQGVPVSSGLSQVRDVGTDMRRLHMFRSTQVRMYLAMLCRFVIYCRARTLHAGSQ